MQQAIGSARATGATAAGRGDFATARPVLSARHPGSATFLARLALYTGERAPRHQALAALARVGDLGAFQGSRTLVLGMGAILDGDLGIAREHLRAARGPGIPMLLVRGHLMRVTAALGD